MSIPRVRVTAVLLENERILLLQQRVTESSERDWSLPGGGLNFDESIEQCLIREMREETGLTCRIDRLLYICDRIQGGRHVVHLTFLVHRISGDVKLGSEPEAGANKIQSIGFVPSENIIEYCFK